MTTDKFKLPASMLSPTVDPGQLGFEDTSELEPLSKTVGQGRAAQRLAELAQAVAEWSDIETKSEGRIITEP